MCIFLRLRLFDRLDHGIDIIECDLESFEDMSTSLCHCEIIASTADYHLVSMYDEFLKHLFEIEELWLESTSSESDHIEREARLK